jgi:hypothetical protein
MRSAYKELQKAPNGMAAVKAHNLRITEYRKMNSCLNLNALHSNPETKDLNTAQLTTLYEYCMSSALEDKNFIWNDKAQTWSWRESAKKDLHTPTNVREFTDLAMFIRLRERLKMNIHDINELGTHDAVSNGVFGLHAYIQILWQMNEV